MKAAALADPAARHERIRRARFWRRWTDAEGARCGMYKMTPEAAAILEANAQPFIDAAFDTARRAGEHEPSEAYAADGLVAMSEAAGRDPDADADDEGDIEDAPDAGPDTPGGGPGGPDQPRPPRRGPRGRRRRRELIGIVNLESLRRGSVEPGEVCEIAGVGPVPLEVLRDLFSDALLRIVIRDGVDIRTVVHAGRSPSDIQKTAVRVRDDGRCVRPTCGRFIAEIDHVDDYHHTRHTTLTELGGLCKHDHDLKTYQGHRYRHGERGWEWHRPDGAIEYERPPP